MLVSAQLLGIPPATLGAVILSDYPQTQNGIDLTIALVLLVLGGGLILWTVFGMIIRIVLHNSAQQDWKAQSGQAFDYLLLATLSTLTLLWIKWLLTITQQYSNAEDYLF